jgi:hypothetical protein
MFSKNYDPGKNYCFIEYTWASNRNKNMILIFADGEYPTDLIVRGSVHFSLAGWHKFVTDIDPVDLAPTRIIEDEPNIKANRAKLTEKVLQEVYKMREALWENVPSDSDSN